MHQSTYESWTALNKQMSKEKPLQFAVSFDSDEKVWTYSRPAVYVSI
jgi:hypothetical protein